jgi:hypothetical protein
MSLVADPFEYLVHPKLFIETFLWIKDKRGKLVPFVLNNIQAKYLDYLMEKYWKPYEDGEGNIRYRFQGMREINLKARQFGLSTFIRAIFFHDTIMNEGTTSMIYCQDEYYSKQMLQKDKLYLKNMEFEFQPEVGYDTVTVLEFPKLMSSIIASKPGVGEGVARKQGRSVTITNLHVSELAEWQNPRVTMQGLMEAVPAHGNVIIESSPRMVGDYFHTLYNKAKEEDSVWSHQFWAWYDFEDYYIQLTDKQLERLESNITDEEKMVMEKYGINKFQLAWRRFKISEKGGDSKSFIREHPENDYECFEAESELVFPVEVREVTCLPREAMPGHIHAIGVDVGGGGPFSDDSAIVVIDCMTNEQVYHENLIVDPEDLAEIVYQVWCKYPGLVAIESNTDDGLACLEACYKIVDWDGYLFRNNRGRGGYFTGTQKKAMIYQMRQELRNVYNGLPGLKLSAQRIVEEMNWFQKNPDGTLSSPRRKTENRSDHSRRLTDDSIMACMIAYDVSHWFDQIIDIFYERFVVAQIHEGADIEQLPKIYASYMDEEVLNAYGRTE